MIWIIALPSAALAFAIIAFSVFRIDATAPRILKSLVDAVRGEYQVEIEGPVL